MAILLGIDFDNTVVCYDALFHRLAVERGLIAPDVPARKANVRDCLRAAGREDAWTELQGYVYGPGITEAPPFDGALEFLARCAKQGVSVRIVSHKTRQPFIGPPYDLHEAARDWLTQHGVFDAGGINLSREHVFFGLTKQDKLQRIGDLGCTHFVDDLPELLGDPDFPGGVDRILFDPADECPVTPFRRIRSWHELAQLIFAERDAALDAAVARLLARLDRNGPFAIVPLEGGGNHRVFRVTVGGSAFLLKQYFDSAEDPRDRLNAEFSFAQFAWAQGSRAVPEPLACDAAARLGLYEYVDGVRPSAVTAAHVQAAVAFYRTVNERREAATHLQDATDARFSLSEHAAGIERRVASLSTIAADSPIAVQAATLVKSTLRPSWDRALDAGRRRASEWGLDWEATLAPQDRRLSPSDFGFHNALERRDGRVVFVDFEYAGWDDPAKLVSDFFCQPALPVPRTLRDGFLQAIGEGLDDETAFKRRCEVLWPLYQIRWACIMLNDFLPGGASRRRFARPATSAEVRQSTQLQKARQALAGVTAQN